MESIISDSSPILVQFENGILKDEMKKKTTFKLLRSKLSNKRMLLSDTGTLTYTGTVSQRQNSVMKYCIGVVDKKSKKIEDISVCQMCTLKPKLQEEQLIKADVKSVKTFKQKSDTLVEAFGSSKQKRLLSSRKKNEGVQETISDKVAGVAKQILSETPKKSLPKTPSKEEESMIIPPQNKDAKRVQDIFHVDDIISFQDYQFLKKHAQEFIDVDNSTLQTWKEEKRYPEFILHQLSQLPISSAEREEKACYLCYLNYLIIVFRLTYKEIQKRDPCPSILNPLKNSMLDKFTHSEYGKNRCVPKKYKDKALCYILVLCLILEEYELNCNLLLKDLKLGVARITKLLRAVGCSVRTINTKKRKTDEETPTAAEPAVIAVLTLSSAGIKVDEQVTPIKKERKPVIPTKKEPVEALKEEAAVVKKEEPMDVS